MERLKANPSLISKGQRRIYTNQPIKPIIHDVPEKHSLSNNKESSQEAKLDFKELKVLKP
jgi:hypothetical protein